MAQALKDRNARWQANDFYSILGVTPDASAADVKKGFRKAALLCHPDKVKENQRAKSTKHFQLIAEAYEVLSKPASRREYDSIRPAGGQSDAQAGYGRGIFGNVPAGVFDKAPAKNTNG